MTLVEPLVGHLLSRYADTVREGLEKIRACVLADSSFAVYFLLNSQGFVALQELLQRRELCAPVLQTLTQVIEACDNVGVRSSALRVMCRGKNFWFLRKALDSLSDSTLLITISALQFLTVVAKYIPKVILSRFENTVPLHLSCFRLQLPYSQRRVRLARAEFLNNLATSSHANAVEIVVCAHGYLTHLLEDAAELLQEGTEAGVKVAHTALRVIGEHFMGSRISPSQKRSVLLAQKHIIRLLVKAIDHTMVSDYAANILYRMAVELVESPSDYQVMRLDTDDRGMPNYLLFFILRQLRPKSSPASARLVTFILHQAPDLIRPYFTRVSGHLSDDGNSSRISTSTAAVATLNLMTRAMLAPIPYHLAAGKAILQPVEVKALTFFSMSADHVADEVCPAWVAEYVHRLIIGSTDLLMLSFAIQLTHAILTRAKTIQQLVLKIQDANFGKEKNENFQEDWETFNAKVQAALLKAVPRREEFWHRMTQQLHPLLTPSKLNGKNNDKPADKIAFISQRMFLLMELYSDVFNLRMSWLSAVPSFLPTFRVCARPIEDALRRGEGVLTSWPASSVSTLCSLLVSALSNGVSMTKLHHITMSSPKKNVLEWPLMLSLMLWAVKHRDLRDEESQMAWAWVARLMQWVVHSVTVRFVCELEETFLWLLYLDESTLPCFVHLINYLLQRSLSKSADRTAQELMHGETGVIVSAARAFVARGEEKHGAKENNMIVTREGEMETKKQKQQQQSHNKRVNKDASKENGKELWVDDLRENISSFKSVMEKVEREWSRRSEQMRETLPLVFSTLNNHSGKRRIALTLLQAEKEHRALRPLHDQVLEFCRRLRPPTPADDIEEEVELLTMVRSGAMEDILHRFSKDFSPSLWCKYTTLGWELAGFILRSLNASTLHINKEKETAEEGACGIVLFSQSLLKFIAEDAKAVIQVLLESKQTEGNIIGFLLFILSAMRVMLQVREKCFTANKNKKHQTILEDKTLNTISDILLSTYTGSVSTTDRIRYATLLTISYLRQEKPQEQQQEEEKVEHQEHKTAGEGLTLAEDADDFDSSEKWEEEEEEEEMEKEKEKSEVEVVELRKEMTMRVFSGVLVPCSIMDHRFLIMNHQCNPNLTPEVDMLSLLVDTWTDEEVTATALQCPARLNNTILISGKDNAGWDVLRSIFPEFSTHVDVSLASLDSITRESIMDPRYLVPLLHTVLAMPAEQLSRSNIGTKCIPVLLRSLSFTDPQLRRLGATALASVWTPSGPTRIVVGFARLKLTQLSAKKMRPSQQQQQKEKQKELVWNCPRLPAPLSAFLVMALRPLGDVNYPLHNDIMRFLLETQEALSNPVPLHRFLVSFPLACITTPLMIKRHETTQIKEKSTIAASSAEEVIKQLRSEAPVHLDFIIQLIQYACHTNGDMMALIHSESLHAMMMITSMLAASDEMRLKFLRCIHNVCTTSAAVARQAMEEGHVLSWLLGFATQLTMEYGTCVHMYGEPLFMEVMMLLRKLCPLTLASPLQALQVQQQLEHIRSVFIVKRVTTKVVLEAVEDILQEMQKRTRQPTRPPQQQLQQQRKRRATQNIGRPSTKTRRR
ncbi:Nucleolar pre-ribosomal-associated protein 1 [Trypanosoma melophagium]|uniref:Nucleolar pre-ribosomal-associated protein 1 n=1 Tax=Trypanosoma melophagium TaxID=715481 RepID=UPI00351A27A5|nr:Nucleolar pre-ribosomal-associated protein 1 [Trypanosoma melophagium]